MSILCTTTEWRKGKRNEGTKQLLTANMSQAYARCCYMHIMHISIYGRKNSQTRAKIHMEMYKEPSQFAMGRYFNLNISDLTKT